MAVGNERDTCTHTEKLGLGSVDSGMEKPRHLKAQCVPYIQVNRQAGTLHTAEQRGLCHIDKQGGRLTIHR